VAEGLGGSLRTAARSLRPEIDGLYVFLGDMPFIPAGIAARLADMVDTGAPASAPIHNGRRGHPVLFSKSLFTALQSLSGDRGASALLDHAALVDVADDGVLFDVDTPAALAVAERRLGQQQRPLPPL
jgi:molybdenum cofactor cytidylyltransferase